MKEIIISVPEDAVGFVEEFVERIGGIIEGVESKKKISSKQQTTNSQPLDFFGTWPDIPLDPKTYRKKLWREI